MVYERELEHNRYMSQAVQFSSSLESTYAHAKTGVLSYRYTVELKWLEH